MLSVLQAPTLAICSKHAEAGIVVVVLPCRNNEEDRKNYSSAAYNIYNKY